MLQITAAATDPRLTSIKFAMSWQSYLTAFLTPRRATRFFAGADAISNLTEISCGGKASVAIVSL